MAATDIQGVPRVEAIPRNFQTLFIIPFRANDIEYKSMFRPNLGDNRHLRLPNVFFVYIYFLGFLGSSDF